MSPKFIFTFVLYFFQVYRIFLDVLCEFIIQCRVHLNDWLFVLLTRLLHKIGSDILPSLHSKVAKVLDIVRLVFLAFSKTVVFPPSLQRIGCLKQNVYF